MPPDPNEIANREAIALTLDAYTSSFPWFDRLFCESQKFCWFFQLINSKLCKLAFAQQSTQNIPSEWLKCDVNRSVIWLGVFVWARDHESMCVLHLNKSALFWWLTALLFFCLMPVLYALLCFALLSENCPSHSACSRCVYGRRICTAQSVVCLFASVHAELNDINCVVHRTTLPLISFLWKRLSMNCTVYTDMSVLL